MSFLTSDAIVRLKLVKNMRAGDEEPPIEPAPFTVSRDRKRTGYLNRYAMAAAQA